ncbi:unnamed protein product, partial [Medioppia subpectinata]
ILGSPKVGYDLGLDATSPDIHSSNLGTNETTNSLPQTDKITAEDGTDSQPGSTTTGPNTPLVDEPSDIYDAAVTSDQTTVQTSSSSDVNPVVSLAQYSNQTVPMQAYPQRHRMPGPPPQQIRAIRTTIGPQNPAMMAAAGQRNPTLLPPPPRGSFPPPPRPGMPQNFRPMA